jgi:hypothetical protein
MAVCFSANLSDTVFENRWAAEFHRPEFKFKPKTREKWSKVRRVTDFCQYGLSVKMNEEGNGTP